MITYILAFLAMTILDLAWVGYNRATAQGRRRAAQLWAVALAVLSGLNALAIVSEPTALFATAAGAFCGTGWGLDLAAWLERPKSEGPIPAAEIDPTIAVQLAVHDATKLAARWVVQYGPFADAHHGYAKLREEVDELWDCVKVRESNRDLDGMRHEAIQVAAFALKFAAECCREERPAS